MMCCMQVFGGGATGNDVPCGCLEESQEIMWCGCLGEESQEMMCCLGEESQEMMCCMQVFGGGATGNDVPCGCLEESQKMMWCGCLGEESPGNDVLCGCLGEESQKMMRCVQVFGGGVTGNDVLFGGVTENDGCMQVFGGGITEMMCRLWVFEKSQEMMCYVQMFGGGATGNDALCAGVWGRSHRK